LEIPKTPPSLDPLRAQTASLADRKGASVPVPTPGAGGPDIRPLDLAGALQILVAEVELALTEAGLRVPAPAGAASAPAASAMALASVPGQAPPPSPSSAGLAAAIAMAAAATTPAGTAVDGAAESVAVRMLLSAFLRALPPASEPPTAFLATVQRAVQALADGSQTAIDRVAAWRGTPAALTAALQQGRQLSLALIHDDQVQPPILAHPEWLGLAREWARLRRLRRRQERRLLLTDTDADWLEADDFAEPDEHPMPERRR